MQAFRNELDLSRSAFARLLGFHPSYVGKIEDDQRKPGQRFKQRLAKLSKQWAKGPISVDEWGVDEDTFEVPTIPTVAKVTNGREVRS